METENFQTEFLGEMWLTCLSSGSFILNPTQWPRALAEKVQWCKQENAPLTLNYSRKSIPKSSLLGLFMNVRKYIYLWILSASSVDRHVQIYGVLQQ